MFSSLYLWSAVVRADVTRNIATSPSPDVVRYLKPYSLSMKVSISFLIVVFVISKFCSAQESKVISFFWTWSEPIDPTYSNWEEYSGIFKISNDSVVITRSRDGASYEKSKLNAENSSFASSLLHYNLFYWQDLEYKQKTVTACDTIRGMHMTYSLGNIKHSFWITYGCFPEEYKKVLTRIFMLFKKPE